MEKKVSRRQGFAWSDEVSGNQYREKWKERRMKKKNLLQRERKRGLQRKGGNIYQGEERRIRYVGGFFIS